MVNLKQLHTFYTLVTSGTLAKASERLFITAPAVFMQVRSLERHIGYKLIDRMGREIKLTDLGEIVYGYCKRIFSSVEEMKTVIEEYMEKRAGVLRLGMAKSLLNYFMPIILPPFLERYPHIKVKLGEDSTMGLMDGLLNNSYELVLSARIPYPKRLVGLVPFTTSRLYLIASPSSPLNEKRPIKVEELKTIPIIVTDKRSAVRYIVMSTLQRAGIDPPIPLEAGNSELIKQLVKTGRGFSFLPDLCVREEIRRKELSIIDVDGLDLIFNIDIFYVKKKTLSTQARFFLDYLLGIKRVGIEEIVEEIEKRVRP